MHDKTGIDDADMVQALSAPCWRPEARFTTQLFQIARNAALDLLRHRQRIELVSFDADPSHDMVENYTPSPKKQFSDLQRISLLQHAIDMA